MSANNRSAIYEKRQKLWTLLARGMMDYGIDKELKVDSTNIKRYQILSSTVTELSK